MCAVLVACSSTPRQAELTPAAQARVFLLQDKLPGSASVTLLRDKAFWGAGVNYRVLVDGAIAADLGWGEWVSFQLQPGERLIELRHPSPTMGAVGDSATLNAQPNGHYFYRINSELGQMRLLRTTEASAVKGE